MSHRKLHIYSGWSVSLPSFLKAQLNKCYTTATVGSNLTIILKSILADKAKLLVKISGILKNNFVHAMLIQERLCRRDCLSLASTRRRPTLLNRYKVSRASKACSLTATTTWVGCGNEEGSYAIITSKVTQRGKWYTRSISINMSSRLSCASKP